MTTRFGRRRFLAAATAGLCASAAMGATLALVDNAAAMTAVPAEDASAWRLFGRDGVRVPNGVAQYADWREVLRRSRLAGSPTWQRIVARVHRRAGDDLLHLVSTTNTVLNGLPYRADEDRFRVGDRWLDPDTFVTYGGDCEDYAIAKYFLLRRLGVPASTLRLVTGLDSERARGHALLAARVEGRILVLDNRFAWPQRQEAYTAFRPRLSFNETDLWLYR